MRSSIDLDEITLILPCYNEEGIIAGSIKFFKKEGFRNIFVVDDNSTDNTLEEAKKERVYAIKNIRNEGYNITLQKGLYEVRTKYAFICSPGLFLGERSLFDFLNFAIKGKHSLLFPKGKKSRLSLTKISPVLTRKYGINLEEPSFWAYFVG